jgi:hypothetical protein
LDAGIFFGAVNLVNVGLADYNRARFGFPEGAICSQREAFRGELP